MWSFEETYTNFFCDTTELSYVGFSEMIFLYEERVFWNITDPIIESPFVSPYTLSSPVNGYKYATTNLSLLIYATSNFSNCTYKLSDYVAENCVFNTSQNFNALFGWNEIKICGSNATLTYCETFNFWADKQNKTVSDYFPFIIILILSLFLLIHGFTSLGISGILGSVLMIITAIMSLAFFHWILCACLVVIAFIGMFGAFTK
jgi:hypothetical protein